MRGPSAAAIELSDRQRTLLTRLQQRQTACQCLVRRAGIILALATTPCIGAVAHRLGLTRMTVRHWRDRWLHEQPALQVAEQEQADDPHLADLIEQALTDAPRPGAPATFAPEQIVQVIAVACEPPEKSGRPLDHWTARELADEVQKRQIVRAISPRTVGRFLKGGRLTAPSQPLLAERQPRGPRSVPRPGGRGV